MQSPLPSCFVLLCSLYCAQTHGPPASATWMPKVQCTLDHKLFFTSQNNMFLEAFLEVGFLDDLDL